MWQEGRLTCCIHRTVGKEGWLRRVRWTSPSTIEEQVSGAIERERRRMGRVGSRVTGVPRRGVVVEGVIAA